MTAGGAAGVVTVDEVADGDALGSANTQQYGFQYGIDVTDQTRPRSSSHTSLPAPFAGRAPSGAQSYGVFVGTGSQDDYVKLAVAANGGAGGFDLVKEQGGTPDAPSRRPARTGPARSRSSTSTCASTRPPARSRRATRSTARRRSALGGGRRPCPRSWFIGRHRPRGRASSPPRPDRRRRSRRRGTSSRCTPVAGRGAAVDDGRGRRRRAELEHLQRRVVPDHERSRRPGSRSPACASTSSPSLLPDLVFDPNGTGGDTLGKGFTVDSNPGVGDGRPLLHRPATTAASTSSTRPSPTSGRARPSPSPPTSTRPASREPAPPGPERGGQRVGPRADRRRGDGHLRGRHIRDRPAVPDRRAALDRPEVSPGRGRAGEADGRGRRQSPTPRRPSPTRPRRSGSAARAGASVRLLAVEAGAVHGGRCRAAASTSTHSRRTASIGVGEQTATIGAGGSVDIPVTLASTLARAAGTTASWPWSQPPAGPARRRASCSSCSRPATSPRSAPPRRAGRIRRTSPLRWRPPAGRAGR